MIKSLLEPDEKQPEEIAIGREETASDESKFEEEFENVFAEIESQAAETNESSPQNFPEISQPPDDLLISAEKPLETTIEAANEPPKFSSVPIDEQPEDSPADAKIYESNAEDLSEEASDQPLAGFPVEEADAGIFNQTATEKIVHEPFEIPKESVNFTAPAAVNDDAAKSDVPPAEAVAEKVSNENNENSETVFRIAAEPESFAETARQSGLAYAAAITLFGSVVFMLIIGWFADLLLGSSPFGIVGGIILGALIGFVQFFRLTSQIFKK